MQAKKVTLGKYLQTHPVLPQKSRTTLPYRPPAHSKRLFTWAFCGAWQCTYPCFRPECSDSSPAADSGDLCGCLLGYTAGGGVGRDAFATGSRPAAGCRCFCYHLVTPFRQNGPIRQPSEPWPTHCRVPPWRSVPQPVSQSPPVAAMRSLGLQACPARATAWGR